LSSVFKQPQTTKKRGGHHPGRALRYARGSARGLLHQSLGHCPLTTLSDEPGNHRNTEKSLLEASRNDRFVACDQDFGPVFLREQAIKAPR